MLVQPLRPLVEHAVAVCAPHSHVSFDLRAEPGEVLVAVDAVRMMQALVALLSHTLRSVPAGSVVEIGLQRKAASVRIAVSGIADDAPQLHLVAAIIEQHRGTVGFHSKPGFTTEFYADLPLAVRPRTS